MSQGYKSCARKDITEIIYYYCVRGFAKATNIVTESDETSGLLLKELKRR
jgi:hypothetical protein